VLEAVCAFSTASGRWLFSADFTAIPPGSTYNSACRETALQENVMDKNRIEGTKHEVKGAVKEGVGKVTNNPVKEAAGNLEKNAGKIQKEIGKEKDRQRDYDKHH
jgi:uncharacterized protein YjbJ (UPF0337 family)